MHFEVLGRGSDISVQREDDGVVQNPLSFETRIFVSVHRMEDSQVDIRLKICDNHAEDLQSGVDSEDVF